jgi:hypothetical protein
LLDESQKSASLSFSKKVKNGFRKIFQMPLQKKESCENRLRHKDLPER